MPAAPIILLYGPDAGLVRERARRLDGVRRRRSQRSLLGVRLDGDELSAEALAAG